MDQDVDLANWRYAGINLVFSGDHAPQHRPSIPILGET